MSKPIGTNVERLRYWQGQKLLSRDFRDQVEYQAQLRWWHNRALHNTFGVRYGLTVSGVTEGGEFTGVSVTCGLAYDCYGRELILQTARKLPRHPLTESRTPMTLLLRYKETSRFPRKKDLPDVCPNAIETADLLWKPTAGVELEDGVPLARTVYDIGAGGAISLIIDPGFRTQVSRPLARPRIESGATIAGDTQWEIWSENLLGLTKRIQQVPLGVQVSIDTSAAGFTRAPCYFAWLQGSLWNQSNIEFFPVPLTHIDKASPTGFRFRMWMPMINALLGSRVRSANNNNRAVALREAQPHGFETEFVNFARRQKLYVCWIGIGEMPAVGCEEPEECVCHTVSED
jgi:hypothetical protein